MRGRSFGVDMFPGVELPVLAGRDGTLAEKLSAEMGGIVETGFVGDLFDRHHGVFQQTAGMGDAFFPDGVANGAPAGFRIDPAEIIGMALELFRNERGGDFLFEMQQDEPVGFFDQAQRRALGNRFRGSRFRFADQKRRQIVAGFRVLLRFLLQKKQIAEGCERFGIPDRCVGRAGAENVLCIIVRRSEVHPEEGEVRGIGGESSVPASREEQKTLPFFQMELPVLFEHVERSGKHIDQFMGGDDARGMPAVSAGNETSGVMEKKDRILFQSRNSPFPQCTPGFCGLQNGTEKNSGIRCFSVGVIVSVSVFQRDVSP